MGKITKEKRERIQSACQYFQEREAERRAEVIFELAMVLGLKEETVEVIWDDSL